MSASSARSRRPAPFGGRAGALAPTLLPPVAYLALSLLFFGWHVWDQPDAAVVGKDEIDPSGFIWCLAWWPHALLTGLDPFITDAIFAPDGYNLTWAASLPGPALLLAPVTLLASPTVSFNVLMLLSPALSAWAAFLLCRHLTGAVLPSFVGGYLFGFSSYALGTIRAGSPNLAMMALVPTMVLLIVRRTEGSLAARPFVLLMTAALVAQLLTGSEVMALTTLFGVIALALAYILLPGQRAALRGTGKLLVAAYAAAGLLLSPFLLAMLEPHAVPSHVDPRAFVNDVHSLFVPEELQLGGDARRSWWEQLGFGYAAGGPSYLGLPLLAILAAFAWQHRRRRVAQLVIACLMVFLIASLGPRLTVGGNQVVPLPWELFVHLPLFKYAIPMRFAAFTFLAAGVAVAMWLAARPSRRRWALTLLAVAFLLPSVGSTIWWAPAEDPPFFTTKLYREHLREGDRVLTIPIWGRNTRWAARTEIDFRLAGGYVGSFPRSYTRFPAWQTLWSGRITPDSGRQLQRFIAAKGATVLVIGKQDVERWQPLLTTLGVKPRESGGVLVYRLRRPSAAP